MHHPACVTGNAGVATRTGLTGGCTCLGGNAITVSGISKDDGVYFRVSLWGPGSVQNLQWSFPRSLLGPLKAAGEHSAATFHAGDLASSH
jgi:hypothetical protein